MRRFTVCEALKHTKKKITMENKIKIKFTYTLTVKAELYPKPTKG